MPQSLLELRESLTQLTVSELKKVLSDQNVTATGARRKEDLLLKVVGNKNTLDLAKKRLSEKLALSAVTVPADLGRSSISPYIEIAKSLDPEASPLELDQLALVLKAVYKMGFTVADYVNPPEELQFVSKEGWKHAVKQRDHAKEVVSLLENGLATLEAMEGSVFRHSLGDAIQTAASLLATIRDISERAAKDVVEHELLYSHICLKPRRPGYEDEDENLEIREK